METFLCKCWICIGILIQCMFSGNKNRCVVRARALLFSIFLNGTCLCIPIIILNIRAYRMRWDFFSVLLFKNLMRALGRTFPNDVFYFSFAYDIVDDICVAEMGNKVFWADRRLSEASYLNPSVDSVLPVPNFSAYLLDFKTLSCVCVCVWGY